MRLRLVLPLLLASLVYAAVSLGPSTQENSVEVVPVTDSIAMLEGGGGNIGLFKGPEGVLWIDTNLPNFKDGILAAGARYLGIEGEAVPKAPRYLVDTHWHGDHVGNNLVFGGARVSIIAQDNVRARMVPLDGIVGRGQAYPSEALPTVTFEEGLHLHLNGESIHLVHFPAAHTDGDCALFFEKAHVVHCGDIFFNHRFPFIDSSSGGTPRGYLAAMDGILERIDDTWRVIPGHGSLATRKEMVLAREMLATSIERVQAALDAGQSAEEMVEQGLLGDFSDEWGWAFVSAERFTEELAKGLSQ